MKAISNSQLKVAHSHFAGEVDLGQQCSQCEESADFTKPDANGNEIAFCRDCSKGIVKPKAPYHGVRMNEPSADPYWAKQSSRKKAYGEGEEICSACGYSGPAADLNPETGMCPGCQQKWETGKKLDTRGPYQREWDEAGRSYRGSVKKALDQSCRICGEKTGGGPVCQDCDAEYCSTNPELLESAKYSSTKTSEKTSATVKKSRFDHEYKQWLFDEQRTIANWKSELDECVSSWGVHEFFYENTPNYRKCINQITQCCTAHNLATPEEVKSYERQSLNDYYSSKEEKKNGQGQVTKCPKCSAQGKTGILVKSEDGGIKCSNKYCDYKQSSRGNLYFSKRSIATSKNAGSCNISLSQEYRKS